MLIAQSGKRHPLPFCLDSIINGLLQQPPNRLRVSVNNNQDQQIVPGISLSTSGQATVDPALTEVLIDIAIKIDDMSKFPVDVEHVLAAIVMAARNESIAADTELSSDNEPLIFALAQYVETVFEKFGGKVGKDD